MANTTEQALKLAKDALEEAANVIEKIKPAQNGNGTIIRARDAAAAVEAALAQPAQEPVTGEFISVTVRLPKAGQRIQGLSRSGAWIETFDPSEPLGHMTHWRAVDDEANDATENPITETMIIDYERGGRFWHTDCVNHLGGVMRVVSNEEKGSTIECLHCGKRGSYPAGSIGKKTVPVISATHPQPSAPVAQQWISVEHGAPEVKPGSLDRFLVACRRAHNGKTYVFEASYLNAYVLDEVDGDNEKPFTGWHQNKEHGDYDEFFEPVETGGDVVTHYMPLPAAPSSQKEGEQKNG